MRNETDNVVLGMLDVIYERKVSFVSCISETSWALGVSLTASIGGIFHPKFS